MFKPLALASASRPPQGCERRKRRAANSTTNNAAAANTIPKPPMPVCGVVPDSDVGVGDAADATDPGVPVEGLPAKVVVGVTLAAVGVTAGPGVSGLVGVDAVVGGASTVGADVGGTCVAVGGSMGARVAGG